ncbi:MAG: ATP-dependent DNA helicase RecG [Candidatus Palauibacterales bacterium]|nr:ATP-dependent DNA helicase RecG [Candidatus Palauibacterales bacterium]MDP2483764.1 ATP-dependent DNA helicase RecG [Candidatus Palauibacterales bacterium]
MPRNSADLHRPVQYLKGVGPRRAEKLARLGVFTARDLLFHVPYRYEDATTVARIASLRPGDDATIIGRVVSKGVIPTRRRLRIFHAVLKDDSGLIECAWPGQPWLDNTIRQGDLLLASGTVGFYHGRQMRPREHTLLASGSEAEAGSGRVFPVYRATEGLSHRQIRTIVESNLDGLLEEVAEDELFGPDWLRAIGTMPLPEALARLHRPDTLAEVEPAMRRLAYEELFFLQLLHARARYRYRSREAGLSHAAPPELTERFLRSLPYRLTAAQKRAWEEIRADLESPARMYRLLQGDVGCGKTVVAAAAMVRVVDCGRQAILMAPTELLAEQHLRTLAELLQPVGIEPTLLTGSVTGQRRSGVLEETREGRAPVVIGTHALIQEGVEFGSPGLVVIDEQHRFGVEQRRALRDAGGAADTLVMSATPIPRSLALAVYGDLDLSVIDEMPPGRKSVITGIRGTGDRAAAFEFLRGQLAAGRQAYVVYPLIDESDAVEAAAATRALDELSGLFPEFRLDLLHGRLGGADKEEAMRRFLSGETHLLVATTVIEVGIDVPNATVMLIEHADRFGLAQLHQLRGRVGRGGDQSYCVAFYTGDAPPDRLRAFAATNDGFEIAREDLRLRGQGNLFGAEQHGLPALRFADLERDHKLLEHAREKARAMVEADPELSSRPHRPFGRVLEERYADHAALYAVG